MTSKFQSRSRGLTLVEVLVVLILIGILSGFALQRLLPLIGKAETVAFATVVNQLNSALLLDTAKRIAGGNSHSVSQLVGTNPMDLMLRPPDNYLGELTSREARTLPKRSWYFDPVHKTLLYKTGDGARFVSGERHLAWLEFTVSLVYYDHDGDDRYSPQRDDFGGISLRPSDAYQVLN